MTPEQERLVVDNQKLAYWVANRYTKAVTKKNPAYDEDDLVAVALAGLFRAALKFDPERGFRFSTFAALCIQHEIQHFLRGQFVGGIRIPQREIKRRKVRLRWLDEPVGTGEITLLDALGAKAGTSGGADDESLLDLRQTWQALPEKQRKALRLNAAGMDTVQIGKQMGWSQTWASRVLIAAKAALEGERIEKVVAPHRDA